MRAAVVLEAEGLRRIEIVQLLPEIQTLARLDPPPREARRLGWVSDDELVLWQPADLLSPPASASVDPASPGAVETIWRSPNAGEPRGFDRSVEPLQATERNDVGEARWQGRSFDIERALDPRSGLGTETLRIASADGARALPLPGEPCGPRGQYGRPHFRIDGSGGRGLDLRFQNGGCRAVAIDFATGAARPLDTAGARPGACRESRRVPLSRLRAALSDYVSALETTLEAAGGNPRAAFSLHIDPGGATRLQARDYMGGLLRLPLSPFPIQTPLRRIDVTGVAGAAAPAAPAKDLLEPL